MERMAALAGLLRVSTEGYVPAVSVSNVPVVPISTRSSVDQCLEKDAGAPRGFDERGLMDT